MNKVIKDGKVAVLISYGYGAGFHSWGAPLEAIFDPKLVELVESEDFDGAEEYVRNTYPDVYTGGVARELEYLCDILSPQEMDEVCLWAQNQSDCYPNSEY